MGGIDNCYGGIGTHGHVAFNEPAPGVKDTDPRMVQVLLSLTVAGPTSTAYHTGVYDAFQLEAVLGPVEKPIMGIHLTKVATTCSMRRHGHGELSQDDERI